jgi:PhoPQ-activated pathogenicity-related protein
MGISSYFKFVHAGFVILAESSGHSIATDYQQVPVPGTTTNCMPRTSIDARLGLGRRAPRSWSFIFFLFLVCLGAHAADQQTALDTYVKAPDSHYRYRLFEKKRVPGCRDYLIRMTSQQWRTPAQVNHSLWEHWVRIYVPDTVSSTTSLLYIRGGSISDPRPEPNHDLETLATLTHSVASEVFDIPNEPLTFTGDSFGPRSEDQIIAYTWRKFLETGDAAWPLRLPMTKAAVRAMDTVTSFAASKQGGRHRVDHFVVTGASKRGWTTWTTAAVDARVVGIAPMVIDLLHVVPSFEHHYRVYGFWAPAVKDYYDEGLMDELENSRFRELMDIVEPYSYRDRFTVPKLIINAAGDQFFLPDSSRFYFDDLPGEKHLLYEANADHSLKGTDVNQSIEAFYQSIVGSGTRPTVNWTFESDGSIRATTDTAPLTVTVWQAVNPDHRDFRVEAIGDAYHASPLPSQSPGVYVAHVPQPKKGWTAFFIEFTLAGPGKYPLKFTTAVRVLPDTEPFALPEEGKSHLQLKSEAAHY